MRCKVACSDAERQSVGGAVRASLDFQKPIATNSAAVAPTTSFKSTVVDLARRVSALVCLAGAYQFAAPQFSPIWLAVTAGAALVVATGPRFWAPAGDDVALLPWPQWTELPRYLVPGWVLMLLAGVLRVAKFSPHVVLQAWLAGVACLLVGAW